MEVLARLEVGGVGQRMASTPDRPLPVAVEAVHPTAFVGEVTVAGRLAVGDLFPWLSDHTIRVLSMLGSLGTPLAVAVTVYLALRSEKLRLAVQVDRTLVVSAVYQSEGIRFSITNTGHRQVQIQSVGWVHGWPRWRRKCYFQKTETSLPSRLEPGEHVDIVVPWDGALAAAMEYPRTVRATVSTPIGSKRVAVGRSLKEYFREQRASSHNESKTSK